MGFVCFCYNKKMDKKWHSLPATEVFRELDSGVDGISQKAADERLKKFGPNRIPEDRPASKARIFLEQLKSPLVYVLVIAGGITLFLGEYSDTVIIFGAVVLNTIVGYFQDAKANRALSKLKKVLQAKIIVFRNGNKKEVLQSEVVPGDAVFLRTGGKVPADGRIIEVHNLKINESSLTGEWLASDKKTKILPEETALADRDNIAFMGTAVESGWGKAVVFNTGAKTEIGRLAETIKKAEERKTPHQRKLSRFSQIIGLVIVIISSAIFIQGMLTGERFIEIFATSIAIAVAAIPEGLPMAMTVILALGMQRILKKKGLVRKLASAETLGSASVILTDKTGTLTEAKMEVAGVYAGGKELLSNGSGFAKKIDRKSNESYVRALRIATMCSEAFIENLDEPAKRRIIRGRPTEKALLLAGVQAGFSPKELSKEEPLLDQLLFDPTYKYSMSLRRAKGLPDGSPRFGETGKAGENVLYVLGLPEIILSASTRVDNDGDCRKLLLADYQEIKDKIDEVTGDGLRAIAVGYKIVRGDKITQGGSNGKLSGLVFVGFFSIHDPIRNGAKEMIDTCRRAGMRLIIVTGDHKLTAKAVASKLGFKTEKNNILEGKDLENMTEEEFNRKLEDIEVFARVEPAQKLKIVQAWQRKGEVVAMTGDGINDAPAIKQADIGVALGSGTDVAKEVSDLVLLTDNFKVIVAAVEAGRTIIDNIRKVIVYLLSDSFTEVILVSASLFFGWPLPILAGQILWVNLIEDGPMSISLGFEKKEKDIMKQKPKDYSSSLFTGEMRVLIFIIGIITDLFLLGLFFWLLKYSGYGIAHIRTVVFAGLTIDSLFYIFSCKSLRRSVWQIKFFSNKFLLAFWVLGAGMLLLAIYLPFLREILKTAPLTLFDWQLVLGLGFAHIFLIELTKYYFITRSAAKYYSI